MDLISIITPYYKKKKFINQTINSVLRQTYKNFELIIIYDDQNKEDLNLLKNLTKNREPRKTKIKNYKTTTAN